MSHRFFYSQNWNIAFCDLSPDDLVKQKCLPPVKWLKHPYKDRWFADPFILSVSDNEIVVLVEECPIENPRGLIVELHIDKESMRLKNRYVLLSLGTHLSYPFIFHSNGKTYVCPENGESGKWSCYEYNPETHSLTSPVVIYNGAIADASIIEKDNQCYMVAAKFPETLSNAYLFKKGADGIFNQLFDSPISSGLISRPGGAWIIANSKIYRPVQNCTVEYGGSLVIRECNMNAYIYEEKDLFELMPVDNDHCLGLHTINFKDNLCVIDGCGYLYPFWGRSYSMLRTIKRAIVG